jgi:hypothetical protein
VSFWPSDRNEASRFTALGFSRDGPNGPNCTDWAARIEECFGLFMSFSPVNV